MHLFNKLHLLIIVLLLLIHDKHVFKYNYKIDEIFFIQYII